MLCLLPKPCNLGSQQNGKIWCSAISATLEIFNFGFLHLVRKRYPYAWISILWQLNKLDFWPSIAWWPTVQTHKNNAKYYHSSNQHLAPLWNHCGIPKISHLNFSPWTCKFFDPPIMQGHVSCLWINKNCNPLSCNVPLNYTQNF